MQPPMMKGGGNKSSLLIAIVAIAIITIGFFVFNGKNNDTAKDAMMKDEGAVMKDDKDMMKKDGEAMMEKGGEAMMDGETTTKHVIKYTDVGFSPAAIEINSGETVTFVNESGMNMWVASAVHPTHELLPEFDQKAGAAKGGMYSFTFSQAGVWKFHDHLNPSAKGSITVK